MIPLIYICMHIIIDFIYDNYIKMALFSETLYSVIVWLTGLLGSNFICQKIIHFPKRIMQIILHSNTVFNVKKGGSNLTNYPVFTNNISQSFL